MTGIKSLGRRELRAEVCKTWRWIKLLNPNYPTRHERRKYATLKRRGLIEEKPEKSETESGAEA